MDVALDEFASEGFAAASINRILEAAGMSKGSLYYYFDGKEDLYTHVTRSELGRLFEEAGPFPVPSTRDPDAFWTELADHYARIMAALSLNPKRAALARDWLVASASPPLRDAQSDMTSALVPWLDEALSAGQRARAVRKDVPRELLVALVLGMGQAMDGWLMTQDVDERKLRKLSSTLVAMVRGALAPPA